VRDIVDGCPYGRDGGHVGTETLIDVEEVDELSWDCGLNAVGFWQSQQEDLLS
jgi:hypothetical protein